ncbi:MAG: hypothetical protein AB7L41_16130 [Flavobacteriaceae bacterium]
MDRRKAEEGARDAVDAEPRRDARAERLAAALRANLARRKQQSRARREEAPEEGGSGGD